MFFLNMETCMVEQAGLKLVVLVVFLAFELSEQ